MSEEDKRPWVEKAAPMMESYHGSVDSYRASKGLPPTKPPAKKAKVDSDGSGSAAAAAAKVTAAASRVRLLAFTYAVL